MKRFLCIIFCLTLSSYSYSQCHGRFQTNIFTSLDSQTYKFGNNTTYTGANQELYLDLYMPKSDTMLRRPCVVFCFGGAFVTGNRKSPELVYMANDLSQKGYVCASIDYRLDNIANLTAAASSSKAVIRAVQDAKAAVRYLKFMSDSFHIDTNQIFIGGTSAGGVTAMTLGYSQAEEFAPSIQVSINQLGGYEGTTNALTTTSKVKALFSFSGGIGDTAHIGYKDLSVYLNQSVDDNTVPFRVGYPLSGLSPNLLYGSFPISQRMVHQKGYVVIDSFAGSNHPSFTDLNGIILTSGRLKDFLYTQLTCNPTINLDAIQEWNEEPMEFYPNPCQDILNIKGSMHSRISFIQIYNMYGQKVVEVSKNQSQIDISNFPKGIYFIQNETQTPFKLIKN